MPDPNTQVSIETLISTESTLGTSSESYEDTAICSRVLGDIFHFMNQFKIPNNHGLHCLFSHVFQDAVLIPYPNDKKVLEAFLSEKGVM